MRCKGVMASALFELIKSLRGVEFGDQTELPWLLMRSCPEPSNWRVGWPGTARAEDAVELRLNASNGLPGIEIAGKTVGGRTTQQ